MRFRNLMFSGYVVATAMLGACSNDATSPPERILPPVETQPASDSVMIAEFHATITPDYMPSMAYFGRNTPDFSVGFGGETVVKDGLEFSLYDAEYDPHVMLSGDDWATIEFFPYIAYGISSDTTAPTYTMFTDVQPSDAASHPGIYVDSMTDLYIRTKTFGYGSDGGDFHVTSTDIKHRRSRLGNTSATATLPITKDAMVVESWQILRARCVHGGDSITFSGLKGFYLKVDDAYIHDLSTFPVVSLTMTCRAYGSAAAAELHDPAAMRSSMIRMAPPSKPTRKLK